MRFANAMANDDAQAGRGLAAASTPVARQPAQRPENKVGLALTGRGAACAGAESSAASRTAGGQPIVLAWQTRPKHGRKAPASAARAERRRRYAAWLVGGTLCLAAVLAGFALAGIAMTLSDTPRVAPRTELAERAIFSSLEPAAVTRVEPDVPAATTVLPGAQHAAMTVAAEELFVQPPNVEGSAQSVEPALPVTTGSIGAPDVQAAPGISSRSVSTRGNRPALATRYLKQQVRRTHDKSWTGTFFQR